MLESIVIHEKIQGYPFFVYASADQHFRYCEGVNSRDYNVSSIDAPIGDELNDDLTLNPDLSWSENIINIIENPSNTFFDSWSTAESVAQMLSRHTEFYRELKHPREICSPNRAARNGRFLFVDVTDRADQSISQLINPVTIQERLEGLRNTYKELCDNGKRRSICNKVEQEIRNLELQSTMQLEE